MSNDLRHRELGNLTEIPEMLGTDWKVLIRPPEKQILTVVLKNCKESSAKCYLILWICLQYFLQV